MAKQFGLLFWIGCLVVGSTVFLHFTLHGDLSGSPPRQRLPLWELSPDFIDPPVVSDFQIDIDFDHCAFEEDAASDAENLPLSSKSTCGLSNAQVELTATIGDADDNFNGLYLAVMASKDFDNWWQANDILLPRDLFTLNTSSVSAKTKQDLNDAFYEVLETYSREGLTYTPPPNQVPLATMVAPLQASFTGEGDVPFTTARVTAELRSAAAANDGCAGEAVKNSNVTCSVSLATFLDGYDRLLALYEQPKTVKTKVCLGEPGFNYVVACALPSLPSKKAYGTKCDGWKDFACPGYSGPPFYNCRAITTACGSTCKSGASEPTDRFASIQKRHCEGGTIKRRDIEEAYVQGLRLKPGGVLFAIFYVLGIGSTLLIFLPGVGQRQAQRPPWDKLKEALLRGDITTVRHSGTLSLFWTFCCPTTSLTRHRKRTMRTTALGPVGKEDAASDPNAHALTAMDLEVEPPRKDKALAMLVSRDMSRQTKSDEPDLYPVLRTAPRMTISDGTRQLLDALDIREEHEKIEELDTPFAPLSLQRSSDTKSKPNGMSAVNFSISAGEGPNVVLRNLMGKVAANLELIKQLGNDPHTPVQVIDGFADEGHRLGAFYLTRAVSIAFYESMPLSLAAKLSQQWIEAMNNDATAESVDEFEKRGTDVFKMVPELHRRRSEIVIIKYFFDCFDILNGFTIPVDDLFNKLFELPIVSAAFFERAKADVAEHLLKRHVTSPSTTPTAALEMDKEVDNLLHSDALHKELSTQWGIGSPRVVKMLLRDCVKALVQSGDDTGVQQNDPSLPPSYAQLLAQQREHDKLHQDAHHRAEAFRATHKIATTERDDSPPPPQRAATMFDPSFFRAIGQLVFDVPIHTEESLGGTVPLNGAAYLASIKRLDKADLLGCEAYQELRAALDSNEKAALVQATRQRHLAYDHVEVLTTGTSAVLPLYIARGRPDKWQPWTKNNHRRVMMPGVWCSRKPDTTLNFWDARRQLALLESDATEEEPEEYVEGGRNGDSLLAKKPAAGDVRPKAGTGMGIAYMYQDQLRAFRRKSKSRRDSGGSDSLVEVAEDCTQRVPLSKLQVLNTHLGKAGGLNFGLEAILHTRGVTAPSPMHPMFFSIIDARHACDKRYWLNVLPAFHELHAVNGNRVVKFEPEVVLCQVPHSYIGMTADTDKLDVRNDYLFSGIAVVRDRCYGMTSCGTGGTWAVTSSEGAADFFFGRTMIEDTASSHKYFLQGKRSVYLAPKRGTTNQLMRAVPKLGGNYLEALERWDTGAIQVLTSQGLGSGWFWMCVTIMLVFEAAILTPTFVPYLAAKRIFDDHINPEDAYIYVLGSVFWLGLAVLLTFFGFILSLFWNPRKLNFCLRFCIVMFNSVYPFLSVVSLFWLSIPVYLCITGRFPFQLNGYAAVLGSMILKFFEFQIVAAMQKASEQSGAELKEMSIFRSAQIDKVTVPIKFRAVMNGLQTGFLDHFYYHDNSWWESFGAAHALKWVKLWLLTVAFANIAAIIAGPIVLGLAYHTSDRVGQGTWLPVSFGLLQAMLNLWVVWDPLIYLVRGKGNFPRPTLRNAELVIMLFLIIAVFVVLKDGTIS